MGEPKEYLYVITAYTENSVGLLSSIAGIFTRRSLNIEKLLVYPSKVEGIHKFKIHTRTTPVRAREVVLQIEKKVDVIRAFAVVDDERSPREAAIVREFLKNRDKNNI
ncbi:MAG: hypothetical protein MJY60_05225 [Bacteroidales bacterium]|nr:hypothetical protein [Bacteroidales bacterium]